MERMAGMRVLASVLLVFLVVVGTEAATREKWHGMVVDWENTHTKEELEAGAFMKPFKSSRIINGELVDQMEMAPYVGSLYLILDDEWAFACTAVVVDTHVMLTSAHCTFPNGEVDIGVCVSGTEMNEGRCQVVRRTKIPKVYLKSGLNGSGEIPFTHDIALLRVRKKLISRGSKAQAIPVDLAKASVTGRGAKGFVYGFGATNAAASDNDGKLRMLDVRWKRFNRCLSDDTIRGKNFVCSDGNWDGSSGSSCFGDSGGPLVWSMDGSADPDKHVLIGICSFFYNDPALGSQTCDISTPAGYARLSSVAQSRWLKRNMRKLKGSFEEYTSEEEEEEEEEQTTGEKMMT